MSIAKEKQQLDIDISNAIHKALTNGVDPIDVLDVVRAHVAELVATIKSEKDKRKLSR